MDANAIEQIVDEDELYRRLARHCFRPDGSVSSAAFKVNNVYDQSISVDLARLTTAEKCLEGKIGFRIGVLIARDPRTLGFHVYHSPRPGLPAHSLMEGNNNREISQRLAELLQVLSEDQQHGS